LVNAQDQRNNCTKVEIDRQRHSVSEQVNLLGTGQESAW